MARSSVEDFIVDFSKEESSGGGARYKPGTYLFRIAGGKTGTSENKGTQYLELILVFKGGRYNKKKLGERLYLTPKAYSRLRTLMEAVGLKPPAKKLDVVKLIPKLKGKELYCEIDDDDSQDTVRSKVTYQGFISPDDYDPEEDGDEEDEDEEEEDEELEEEDEEEDEDEEDEEDEDEEEEEPAPRRKRGAAASKRSKPAPKKKRKPVDDEDDEDEDEEEEEEEPAPKKRSRSKAKAAPAKKSRKKRKADDDDEDEDLDDLDLDSM